MTSFTFVTALYNIQREQYDNRSYQEYQEWFEKTLTIPVPMVIFTELCNEPIITKTRGILPTKVIYTDLSNTPFYYTTNTVEHIITNTDFKYQIKHPNGLENTCFGYIPIINSKFVWMKQAIQSNYFNTDLFFWIDAGLSRFFSFDISTNNWNNILINQLYHERKMFFQIGKYDEFMKIMNNETTLDESIGKNINYMMAGFWGGYSQLLYDVCKLCEQMYIKEYIEKQRVDNEQVLFGFILKKYREQSMFVLPSGVDYYNYYIFCNKHLI
jgi:hypothetical protein